MFSIAPNYCKVTAISLKFLWYFIWTLCKNGPHNIQGLCVKSTKSWMLMVFSKLRKVLSNCNLVSETKVFSWSPKSPTVAAFCHHCHYEHRWHRWHYSPTPKKSFENPKNERRKKEKKNCLENPIKNVFWIFFPLDFQKTFSWLLGFSKDFFFWLLGFQRRFSWGFLLVPMKQRFWATGLLEQDAYTKDLLETGVLRQNICSKQGGGGCLGKRFASNRVDGQKTCLMQGCLDKNLHAWTKICFIHLQWVHCFK